MVEAREVDHLEGEWLLAKVVWLAEGDVEPDAHVVHDFLPQDDLIERCLAGGRLLHGMPIFSRVHA